MKYLAPSVLFFVSLNSFAMFCPNNFNQINLGDDIAKVKDLCGKPDNEKKYKTDSNVPQEWNYYVKMKPTDTGTIKMTIALTDDKVVNMNVNGVGLTATKICGNPIQIGNDSKTIIDACGKPVFITKANPDSPQASAASIPSKEIIEDTYNTTPPSTLVFENGKLAQRK